LIAFIGCKFKLFIYMHYFIYILFRIAVLKAYVLPFNVLYVFSDIFAFFLNKVFKYRKKIVYKNISACFPDKTDIEIKKIADAFYAHLSDIIVEALKGFTMSESELHKRYNFLNRELLNSYFEKGQNAICVSAHFNNWEWGVLIMGKQFKHKPFGVYKPLSNKYIDAYIERKRKKLDMSLLAIENTVKGMRCTYEKPAVFILIADQSPSSHKKAIWVDFFGIKTACSPGVEVASRLFSIPIIYIISRRRKRGFYEVECTLITDNPSQMAKEEITQKYMSLLEQNIKNEPSVWLWSHRRWKHKYEDIHKGNA